jgi:hypothetical protein
MPGFSDGERERFSRYLSSAVLGDAKLTDGWRRLNPAPAETGAPPHHRTSTSFTWRGALRRESNPRMARYEGMVRIRK